MKIAHLIMAHKHPAQIERLIKALTHDDVDFYIHLDKKADAQQFAYLTQIPGVHFVKTRISVRWASYLFTKAILESTREVLATEIPYDFINLLSGQDYPLKPVETIHKFFSRHVGCSFLSFEHQNSTWWSHAITRVEKYHTTSFKFKGQYALQSLINKVLPKRRFPLPYTLYGGPNCSWWTMGRECAAYLVEFIDANPRLRWFSRFTWGSDEFLLATILMNSPLKDRIVNNNYRYIDWSAGGANPKVLTVEDAPDLTHSHKLFARKFDVDCDTNILDIIDQRLFSSSTGLAA